MNIWRAFLVALQFLTRIPVRVHPAPSEIETGLSLLMYPAVGLVIGVLLMTANSALTNASDLLRAALVLAAWVLITGALHLDGLSDTTDAWVGGRGDRERTMAIMKDSHCGPMGVTALVLVLLIKFSALANITPADTVVLILAPLMARTSVVLLFATTPYVSSAGLGSLLTYGQSPPRQLLITAIFAAGIVLFTGETGVWALLASLMVFVVLRRRMQVHLGGTTGDTAGAMVELIETAVLVSVFL